MVEDELGIIKQAAAEHPLLTPEQEWELGMAVAAGRKAQELLERGNGHRSLGLQEAVCLGKKAQDKLVLHNLRFVISLAVQYQNCGLPLEDLIQEGNLGLLWAAEKFDPKIGRFTTCAEPKIRGRILAALNQQKELTRFPTRFGEDLYRLSMFPSLNNPKEVAQKLDFPFERAKLLLYWLATRRVNLDSAASTEESNDSTEVFLDVHELTPEDVSIQTCLREEVANILKKLSPREARVITQRFGLHSEEPRTLEEIGVGLGVSRQRVNEILQNSFRKLRSSPQLAVFQENS